MPVLTKINTNAIADDAVTGDKFSGASYIPNSTSQDISGTYSENRMYTSDAYTLSGNTTVNSHLSLSTVKSSGDVVLTAGGAYTLTGTGVLSAGSLLAKTNTDVTGMTGELESTVTGSPNLNLSNSTFPLDSVVKAQVVQTSTAWTLTSSTARINILELKFKHLQNNPNVLVMVSGLLGIMWATPNGAAVSDDQGYFRIYDETNDENLTSNRVIINQGYANTNRSTVINSCLSGYQKVNVDAGGIIQYVFQAWPTSTGYAKVTINGHGSATSYGTTTMTVFELKT